MGRFLSIVAVLAACGDNLDSGGAGPGPNDDVGPNNNGDIVPRYVPQVCSEHAWSANIADPAMNLSVAALPTGAAVLAVPEAGGTTIGFALDTRMHMIGDTTKVDFGTDFGQVTASIVGDLVVASAVSNGSVFVHVLDHDFSNPQWIAKLPGNFISEPTFVHTQADLVMPVAGDDGLTLYRFADSLEPLETKLVLATKPATAMTSAQLGAATMTAWSTAGDCYLMMNAAYAPGPSARVNVACDEPRLAMNQETGEGALVFESPDGIRLMNLWATQMGGDARVLREGSAPRVVFDGSLFWISYLDTRGEIVVGFLDADRRLVSMSLGGMQPYHQSYELAMVMGSPWVFSVDANGYTAQRMCVDAQW